MDDSPQKSMVEKLRPEPLLRTSSMALSSIPPLRAIAIASDVATNDTANRILLVSFMSCPAPGLSPATTTLGPHRSNTGRSCSTVSGLPATIVVNVPLNNGLQALDANTPDGTALAVAREAFEVRWNRWNRIRTVVACLVTVLLLVVLFRF